MGRKKVDDELDTDDGLLEQGIRSRTLYDEAEELLRELDDRRHQPDSDE